jgi:hypothetical protein
MTYEFFSLLPLGEGPGMRAYERNLFSNLCFVGGAWHSTTIISIEVDVGRKPSPQPSPSGRGRRELQVVARMFKMNREVRRTGMTLACVGPSGLAVFLDH